jgi:hypothetical protein
MNSKSMAFKRLMRKDDQWSYIRESKKYPFIFPGLALTEVMILLLSENAVPVVSIALLTLFLWL